MKILLVEDDQLTAAAMIETFLEQATVDHANDAAQGLELGLRGDYDVMIVDRGLPDGDGLSVIQRLREEGKATPVLILSAQTRTEEHVAGLRAGADACLDKPCDFGEVLAQVQALTRRAHLGSASTVLQVEDLTIDLMTHAVQRAGVGISLLPREFQLLRELMRNAGEVVTRSAFWESIWGYRFDPGTGVLEVHIARLRSKIDRGFAKPLIQTVRGVGYSIGATRLAKPN
jgi:two-component system OmpR family response regulator